MVLEKVIPAARRIAWLALLFASDGTAQGCAVSNTNECGLVAFAQARVPIGGFLLWVDATNAYQVQPTITTACQSELIADRLEPTPWPPSFASAGVLECTDTIIRDDGTSDGDLNRGQMLLKEIVIRLNDRLNELFIDPAARPNHAVLGCSGEAVFPEAAHAGVRWPPWILSQANIETELLLFLHLHEIAHQTRDVEQGGTFEEFLADEWAARFGVPLYFGSEWTPEFAQQFFERLECQIIELHHAVFTDDTFQNRRREYGSLACRVNHIKGQYLLDANGVRATHLPAECQPCVQQGNLNAAPCQAHCVSGEIPGLAPTRRVAPQDIANCTEPEPEPEPEPVQRTKPCTERFPKPCGGLLCRLDKNICKRKELLDQLKLVCFGAPNPCKIELPELVPDIKAGFTDPAHLRRLNRLIKKGNRGMERQLRAVMPKLN